MFPSPQSIAFTTKVSTVVHPGGPGMFLGLLTGCECVGDPGQLAGRSSPMMAFPQPHISEALFSELS